MANYSGYSQQQYDNQKAYLDNLSKTGTAGQVAWAQSEMSKLNSQYGGNKNTSGTTSTNQAASSNKTPASSNNVASSGNKNTGNSGGANYSGYTQSQYDNQSAYLNNLIEQGGGNAEWAKTELNNLNSQYGGNNNAGNIPSSNVNNNATTKDYLTGNNDLQYALQQAGGGTGVDDYVMSLYNRIGKTKADGSGILTLADIDAELARLGLSDYNSQNAILTASGKLLPGNDLVKFHDDNGQTSNSQDSKWASYGGMDYLISGDSANYVDYVNGKTGNTNNLSMIFGDMANNPYAMQDPEFLAQYNQNLNNFNNSAGITTANPGSITGNINVDNVINYANSLNNYNQATGGSMGTSNLLEMLQGYLNNGLQANQDFLAQQRAMAEQQAQRAASDAYVNKVLAGDDAKEQMSALGLGTTGALQSALMGVQGDYSSNLATIDQNLATMLNGLSEQELQVLSDYYNNMTNYAYQVTNDEANRALQQAQLALQQQQAMYDQQMAQQQLALQQQQWEWQQQQYADEQALNKSNNEYNQALDAAAIYQSMNKNGQLSDQGLINALAGLGLISGNYFNSAGSVTGNATGGNGKSGGTAKKSSNGAKATTQQTTGQSLSDQLNALYGDPIPFTSTQYLAQAISNNQKPDMNVLNKYLGIN